MTGRRTRTEALIAERFGQLDPGVAYAACARIRSRSKDLIPPAEYAALTTQLDAQMQDLVTRRNATTSASKLRTLNYTIAQLQVAQTELPEALQTFVQQRVDAINPYTKMGRVDVEQATQAFRDTISNARSRLPIPERAHPAFATHITSAVTASVDALARDVLADAYQRSTQSKGR